MNQPRTSQGLTKIYLQSFFESKKLDSNKIFLSESSRHASLEAKDALLSGKTDDALQIITHILAAARENGDQP